MEEIPAAWGPPPAHGRIRTRPEDFQVEELLGFTADGSGAHLLLYVEKRGANSGWVAAALARVGQVAAREVGFSGHKDRDAVTRQYMTLPGSARAPAGGWTGFEGEGFRVLSAMPHGRKLRTGAHRANRFRIAIRALLGDHGAIDARLRDIARSGVPNYFGPQRFGRDGANLATARNWAAGGSPPRERAARSFALSAARSRLFNDVLARRVAERSWDILLPGDAAILDAFCLNEPALAKPPLRGDPQAGAAWILEQLPALIVVHTRKRDAIVPRGQIYRDLIADPRFTKGWREQRRFNTPGGSYHYVVFERSPP